MSLTPSRTEFTVRPTVGGTTSQTLQGAQTAAMNQEVMSAMQELQAKVEQASGQGPGTTSTSSSPYSDVRASSTYQSSYVQAKNPYQKRW